MKPKRRRLASVEVEIARVAAPPPVIVTVDVEPMPFFEVVREHPVTGRLQLAAWTVSTAAKADALAATLNERTAKMGGLTLASSGVLESGWLYRSRPAS